MEERQWIREIQKGNKKYLQDIAQTYYDDIYRFCCYQTGNPEDSYDLCQSTFLRFIRYVDNYHYHNLKGYLLTIAMNVCKDYFTEINRRRSHMEECEKLEEYCSDPCKDPESVTERADKTNEVFQILKKLPDRQREAIILHYYYDMKYREIARLTGVGISTVKSRMKQGTEKLKELLRKEDFL